jgi:hypothetical protein
MTNFGIPLTGSMSAGFIIGFLKDDGVQTEGTKSEGSESSEGI